VSAKTVNLYVIYDHPFDYPDDFVIRRWEMQQPKEIVGLAKTLEQARAMLKSSVKGVMLTNIGRYGADDPKITEVWL
jgi:hypothetical protein